MSMSHWIIEGVGLNVDDIIPHISKEKAAKFLIEQLNSEPEIVESLRGMISSGDFSGFDIGSYLYGEPFEDAADLLAHCDDTDSITCGNDGESGCYFYYPPSMPWEMCDTDPKTIKEVHERIIAAVQKIADLSAEEIDPLINDSLYIVGFG